MMAFTLNDVATQAENLQVFQYLIPFALVFAVTKGILSNVGVFGSGDTGKKAENLISLSIAFFVAFSNSGTQFYTFLVEIANPLSVSLLGILGIMLIAGLVFQDNLTKGWGQYAFGLLVLLSVVGVFYGTSFSQLVLQGQTPQISGVENLAGLAIIGLILVLIGWTMGLDDALRG